MSKKKKNGKPTNRELRRARERATETVVATATPVLLPLPQPSKEPRYRMGDLVKVTNRVYSRFGDPMVVAGVNYRYGDRMWWYQMAGMIAAYPEIDVQLVEGTPARAAGLDLGEL